ncbi:MAG TPA: thrombospondin type 3 repeat-containing protein [Saprospiraceae bacterium]|nr:thrombospondin type 3 repeat-containing protein [Saprospiraceae bacterium]HPN67969.1 thrombospondin type 3 repeat-containing protein [Saprospiraceae bacterium]
MRTLVNFILCVVFSYASYSQSCNVGTLLFTNQAQVDQFPANYPGCSNVNGNIGITGTVENLDSLIQIERIVGSLQISNAQNVIASKGFGNLEIIGSDFIIYFSALDSLGGFSKLRKIGGNFRIDFLSESFENTLPNLDTVISNVYLSNTHNLKCKFKPLKFFDGSEITIHSYEAARFRLFNDIDTIHGNLLLGSDFQEELDGFDSLKVVEGGISISNSKFTGLSGFISLKEAGTIYIQNNQYFSTLNGLNSLIKVGNFDISRNSFLGDLNALNNNLIVENSFNIIGNPFLSLCNINSVCISIYRNKANISNNGSNCSNVQEVSTSCGPTPDQDNDGINDFLDNCISTSNPNQQDSNYDGVGDKCDCDSDYDGDGIKDCNDNCPNYESVNQSDVNSNGIGDICDCTSDTDNDFRPDCIDNCPANYNPTQDINACTDTDNDGIYDDVDNCIDIANSDQADDNNNGIGNVCEPPDADGDGISDEVDNCVNTYNPGQVDCNQNGVGDVCDIQDVDCDGIADANDNCPSVSNPNQIDLNNNMIGDACENFPKMGFGTDNPKAGYQFSNGDIYIENPEKGIIMRDNTGNCFRLTIKNGQIKTTAILCP